MREWGSKKRADNVRMQEVYKLPGRGSLRAAVQKKPNGYYASTGENQERRAGLFKEPCAPALHKARERAAEMEIRRGVASGALSEPEPGEWLDVSGWSDEECHWLGRVLAAAAKKEPGHLARDTARVGDEIWTLLEKAKCPRALARKLGIGNLK